MGTFYLVDPLDDEDREWLGEVGVALPKGKKNGRNPTPAEIRAVCDAIDGFKVTYNASPKKKFWQAVIEGTKGKDKSRGTFVDIDKWGGSETRKYKITFDKGDPALVLAIAHALSSHCGPLVVTGDSYDIPVVVWPEADLKKLIRNWDG